MTRTQVYLDDHQPIVVKLLAKQTNRSEAEILREAIEKGLQLMKKEKTSGADALLGLAELGKKLKLKANSNFSTKIDDFLYGDTEDNSR